MWASLLFLYLFLQGYGYIFLLDLLPRLGHLRSPAGDATPPPYAAAAEG